MNGSGRKLRARVAAFTSWANTSDPTARTAPARTAFLRRFEDAVDPERKLPPPERERRAAAARSAFYATLAYKSARARSKAKVVKLPADYLDELVA